MKETILLFNVTDKSKRFKIEMALFPLKVRVRYVGPEEYSQRLGYLAGLKDVLKTASETEAPGPSDTMLVFAFMDDAKLNQALAALRRSGAGPLPYKAILTPTNQFWTPLECFEEIKKEHESMHP